MNTHEGREMAQAFNVPALRQMAEAARKRSDWMKYHAAEVREREGLKASLPYLQDSTEFRTFAAWLDSMAVAATPAEESN